MKKILLVDNDRMILEFMTDFLSEEGYEVVTAKDALSALNALKVHTPDFILIDLIMPGIDGKKLCRIIRDKERLRSTCLILLSATLAEEAINIREVGANAFIAKGPFDQMAQNVLWVLDHPEEAHSRCLSGEIIGINEVFPRRITRELLSIKKHFELVLETLSEGILEMTSKGEIVYAIVNNVGLFRSRNSGVRWEWVFLTGYSDRVEVDPTNPDRLYVSKAMHYDRNLYRSEDGGDTWTAMQKPIPGDNAIYVFASPHDGTLYGAHYDAVVP